MQSTPVTISYTAGGREAGEGSTPNKRLKTRSEVWEHFIKIDNGTKANCKYCNRNFSLKCGTTTHLKRHLSSCDKVPEGVIPQPSTITENNQIDAFVINQPSTISFGDMVRNYGLTQEKIQELEVKKAILADFLFAASNVKKALSSLMVVDMEKEIYAYHQREKEKLIAELGNLTSRVCFSIGIMRGERWISVTAHFINDDYKLVKRLVGFKKVPDVSSQSCVADIIESCISDWKIENKIFTLTTGWNWELHRSLKRKLQRNLDRVELGLFCFKEELARDYYNYLKRNCYVERDEIITFLQDVLETVSVKRKLDEIAKEKGLHPINADWLNGQRIGWCAGTQVWRFCCSVVKMFKEALLYKEVFCQGALALALGETNQHPISEIDPHHINWSNVEEAVEYFERIDHTIYLLCSSEFPTSNLCIPNGAKLCQLLREYIPDSFDEFGANLCRTIYYVACVLDPRYKFIYVEYLFTKDDFEDLDITCGDIHVTFESLFDIYAKEETNQVIPLPVGTANTQNEGPSSSLTNPCPSRTIDGFALYAKELKPAKREIYQYLMDETVDTEDTNLDLLGWWKENRLRYPILSRMARDVFAIPVCIYNVEENLGLDLSLFDGVSPELVEAVICSKDWILSDV